jgi:hypothetical protein
MEDGRNICYEVFFQPVCRPAKADFNKARDNSESPDLPANFKRKFGEDGKLSYGC